MSEGRKRSPVHLRRALIAIAVVAGIIVLAEPLMTPAATEIVSLVFAVSLAFAFGGALIWQLIRRHRKPTPKLRD